MPDLYTYCIPYDDGAAPNPFWGVCTLAICKPVIRRVAKLGDWVVGTGSKNSPQGDISGRVVYAMRVSGKLSLKDYDAWTRTKLPQKIPDLTARDRRKWVGDSIYDFSGGKPVLRPSVHTPANRRTDLGGKYVLLSDHFFYFGDHSRELPARLLPVVHQGQGHKVRLNREYVRTFVEWIHGLGLRPNRLYGEPALRVSPALPMLRSNLTRGAAVRAQCGVEDQRARPGC